MRRESGYGLGKAGEVTSAISKGIEDAKESLPHTLSRETIPHEMEAKFGGARVFMKPAAPDPSDCRRCHACGV